MAVTRDDIFGASTRPEPAVPGSYGERPGGYRLPDATRLGRVKLQVANLPRSLAFYEEVLGMQVVARDATTASLGAVGDARVLVTLEEKPGIRPARGGMLGLYHFAILLPDRPALGRFVQHLAEMNVRAGAGDHLVSEAFYLTDPDGLGIEVYADRPRDTWQRIGRELMLATDPVDARALVAAAGGQPWTGMPAGTVMGHVHLHVGDLERTRAFYSEALGFDRMTWRYPGALFLGAGGYHHHLGTNLWAGPHARPATDDDARLMEWTIEVPTSSDVAAVVDSLEGAGYPVMRTSTGDGITKDPWGQQLRLAAQ